MELTPRQTALRGWLRLFVLLGFTVGLLFFISSRALSDEALAVLPWFCCAFICYLAPVFVSARTNLFSPPGLIGLSGGMGTAAMMALIVRDGGVIFDALGFMPQEQRIDLARKCVLLLVLAHLSYLVGYYRSSGNMLSRIFPDFSKRSWHGGRLVFAIVASSLVVVPIYYLFQQRMGGSLLDVTELGRGKKVLRSDPTLSWMARGILFAFVPTLLLACMAILDRSKRLLAITGVAFLIVAALVTRLGPRHPAILAGLMMLVLFHFLWRKINTSVIVGMLLVAVVAVNMLGSYRSTGHARVGFREGVSNPMEQMAQLEDDRNRLQVLGVLLYYFPDHQDHLMGESFATLTIFWVPRWLWPEKMEQFDWWGNRIVQRLVGLPAPVPFYGELYANFSWFGVVLGMALFGAFHRGLDRYREASPKDIGVTLLYTVIATTFEPTTMGISAAAQYAIPITLLIYAVSRPNRTRMELGATGAIAA